MVARWQLTIASATRCAISLISPSPASMACRVSPRHFKASGFSL